MTSHCDNIYIYSEGFVCLLFVCFMLFVRSISNQQSIRKDPIAIADERSKIHPSTIDTLTGTLTLMSPGGPSNAQRFLFGSFFRRNSKKNSVSCSDDSFLFSLFQRRSNTKPERMRSRLSATFFYPLFYIVIEVRYSKDTIQVFSFSFFPNLLGLRLPSFDRHP